MKKITPLVIILIVSLAVAGLAYGMKRQRSANQTAVAASLENVDENQNSSLATVGASGTVRSNQTALLAWQTSGTVGNVPVASGDQVKAGDELAALEPSTLPKSVILAQATLVEAQKNLDDLLNSRLKQAQAQQAVEDARLALETARNPAMNVAQAQQAVAEAQKTVDDAWLQVYILSTPPSQAALEQAHASVLLAEKKLANSQQRLEEIRNQLKKIPMPFRTRVRASFVKMIENLENQVERDQSAYDATVERYDDLVEPANATDLAVANTNLETARAGLADAQREWERVKDGPSEAEQATLEAKLEDAQREWERVKDGPAAEDVQAAEARLAAAEATLNQARIVAPFGGEITRAVSKMGDQVNAGTVAFRLDDLSRLLVDVAVSEVDINQVEVGQDAVLTFDSILGKEYAGRVVEVSSVGETEAGVVNFTVTVEIIAADEQVKPGMTAGVTIVVSKLEDVLLVPNRAVRVEDGQRVVYVLRDGVAVPLKITLGKTSDTASEVMDGDLRVGDLVILNPPVQIQMGPGANGGQNGMFGGG